MLTDVVNLHDVRVVQPCYGLRFPAKPGQGVRACSRAGQDHLQGHNAVQLFLLRLVHNTHAAVAEFADEFVVVQPVERVHGGLATARRSLGIVGERASCGRIGIVDVGLGQLRFDVRGGGRGIGVDGSSDVIDRHNGDGANRRQVVVGDGRLDGDVFRVPIVPNPTALHRPHDGRHNV